MLDAGSALMVAPFSVVLSKARVDTTKLDGTESNINVEPTDALNVGKALFCVLKLKDCLVLVDDTTWPTEK